MKSARRYASVLRGHAHGVEDVAFTPDGQHLVTVSNGGTTRLWPLTARAGSSDRARVLHSVRDVVFRLDVDPHGRYVVTTSDTGRVSVTPLAGGETRVLEGFRSQTWNAAVGPEGRLVAVAGGHLNTQERNLIRVWDLESGEVGIIDRGEGVDFQDRRLHFTHDGRLVYAGSDGIRVWDFDSGASRMLLPGMELFVLDAERGLIHALARGRDAFVRFDMQTEAETTLPIELDSLLDMAVDPKGTVLATAHADGNVQVTPLDGGPSHLLLGHRGAVLGVAISPDAVNLTL